MIASSIYLEGFHSTYCGHQCAQLQDQWTMNQVKRLHSHICVKSACNHNEDLNEICNFCKKEYYMSQAEISYYLETF